ncbi:MAG: efflux RND transporter periplasmic adaptor subunit [Treponema sp.]|jgi:multidrug efflux pump subunit AcrA (membrane-fusion protein)|nr:efflux RND transporter periplasmic adaptor subunit [Treponema sp.]
MKTSGSRNMRHTTRRGSRKAVTIIIWALVLIVTACIVYAYIQKRQPAGRSAQQQPSPQAAPPQAGGGQAARPPQGGAVGQNASAAARNATVVRITSVETGTIENAILINGDILTGREVSIYPTVAGRLAELRLKVGDTVTRGQVVALIDPSRPGEVFSQSPVIATISGTITSSPVSAGNTVSTGTAIYTAGDLSNLLAETFVPERYAASVEKGLTASVSLEAFPDETFAATVDEVSPVLDPSSRTLRIRLKFNRGDVRIKAGMFAQITLVTQRRTGVKVLPRDALINTYGSYIVFTVDAQGRARRKEVTLGLESESMVEIAEGLELGETVIVAGQTFLSDGDPVRTVE